MFYGKQLSQLIDTLRLHLRLVGALQKAGGSQDCCIPRARDSLQIGVPLGLNRGLHVEFEVRQWSKLDEMWGTQNETKITYWTFALHLRTATAAHRQLQPEKLRDAPGGGYEGGECARQQSEAARNDSRGVLIY